MTASEINISLEKLGIFGETRDLYWKIKNLLGKENFVIHKEYIRTLCPGRGNGGIVGKKKFEKMWNTLKQAGLLKVFQVKENNRYTYQYMLLDAPDFTMPPYQILPLKELSNKPCHFAPSFMNRQRAGAVAALGAKYYKEGKIETATQHQPDYLRKSQAERELEEKTKEKETK